MTEEPRKLRELIAEGHEQFWVYLPNETSSPFFCGVSSDKGTIVNWQAGVIDVLEDEENLAPTFFPVGDYADCMAVPIPKPTVTPK